MSSSIVSTATTLDGIKRKRKKWQRRRLILNYILHLWQKARPLHHSPLSHLRLLEDLGSQLIPCHLKFSESSFCVLFCRMMTITFTDFSLSLWAMLCKSTVG